MSTANPMETPKVVLSKKLADEIKDYLTGESSSWGKHWKTAYGNSLAGALEEELALQPQMVQEFLDDNTPSQQQEG